MANKLKYDLILIILVLSAGFIILALLALSGKNGDKVQVRIDGKVVKNLPLDTDIEYEVKSEWGENLLVIKDNRAYIKSASCPDGLCVNTGEISLAGQSIICLPNRVVVEIIGEGASDTDVVVGGRG